MEEEKEFKDSPDGESILVPSENQDTESQAVLEQPELPLEQSVGEPMADELLEITTEATAAAEADTESVEAPSEVIDEVSNEASSESAEAAEMATENPEAAPTTDEEAIEPVPIEAESNGEIVSEPSLIVPAAVKVVADKKIKFNTIVAIIVALILVLVVVFLMSQKTASNTSTNSDVKVSVDGSIEQGKVSILEEVKDDIKVSLDGNDKQTWTKTKVMAFFGNTQKNTNTADCTHTYPLTREIDKKYDSNILNSVLALLQPLTSTEKEAGYVSVIPDGSLLKSIKLDDSGVATATFTGNLNKAAGSCAVTAIKAQIKDTLLQFASVKSVVICIDENCKEDEILQP